MSEVELVPVDMKKAVSQFKGHEEHEAVSFKLEMSLYVIKCSCGTKFTYTRQPIEVAQDIKRQYFDKKLKRWVTVPHDWRCRFQQFCTCDH